MKILHVINSFNIGGAEKMLFEILKENKNKNIQSVFILNDNESILIDDLISSGVKVFFPLKNRFKNLLYLLKVMDRYDVIHAHLFPSLYIVSFLSLFNNKKYVFTEHNSYNRRRDKKYLRSLEKIVYSRYSKIIAISDVTKDNLLKWLGSGFYFKVKTINNGINLNKFTSTNVSCDYLSSNATFKMLMVGSFTPQKDQGTIIRALSLLPEYVVLYLVGDGVLRKQLEDLTVKLNLSERVFFLGVRQDIPEIMNSCNLVIQSSHWEGFGLVAVEAMASNKVVLASNVNGLKQVVDGYGLIFDKGSHVHLSTLILKLIEDEDYMIYLSNLCKRRSLDFSISKLINEYNLIYDDCIL